MVPAGSDRVSRAPPYSGYRRQRPGLRVRGYHPLWPRFPAGSASPAAAWWRPYNPAPALTGTVWADPRSLAATGGITLVFFSSGYLDVSVPRVRLPIARDAPIARSGLPHSDTRGSKGMCPSPRIFAACRVLHRLWEPRHPPCALPHFPRARAPGVRSAFASRPRSEIASSLQYIKKNCVSSHHHHVKEPPPPSGGAVENNGFEPLTPCVQGRCSSQLS